AAHGAVYHALVRAGRFCWCGAAELCRPVVCRTSAPDFVTSRSPVAQACPVSRPADRRLRRDRGPAAQQVHLYRDAQKLLFVLPDRKVRPLGAGRATLSLSVPRRGCCRHFHWRACRRSLWAPGGDLGVDPRLPPLYAAHALSRPLLDGDDERDDRPDPV